MDSQILEQTNDPTNAISPNIVYLTAPTDNSTTWSNPSPRTEVIRECLVPQWAQN